MRLFFSRPPETQPALGRVLAAASEDTSDADVHDKALFYLRLLRLSPSQARDVVTGGASTVHAFAEEDESELIENLASQLNTLAVVYEQPKDTFMKVHEIPESSGISFAKERAVAFGLAHAEETIPVVEEIKEGNLLVRGPARARDRADALRTWRSPRRRSCTCRTTPCYRQTSSGRRGSSCPRRTVSMSGSREAST